MAAKKLLQTFIGQLEKIIIEFNYNEKNASVLLKKLKDDLALKNDISETQRELFDACIYNVLATINSVPTQNSKSEQLISALGEAKEEMRAISELL